MPSRIEQNLRAIRERVMRAAEGSRRDAADVRLVAVGKTHAADILREAIEAGVSAFGENKIQEAEGKISQIGRDAAEWHLIGHLQSNKAKKAVQLFDVIHTLDSIELAERLERICIEGNRDALSVFVQVDLAGEKTKSGIAENDLPPLVAYLQSCDRLKFDGLMILPPFFDDAEATRPFFKQLRLVRDDLLSKNAFSNSRGELSMGMTNDFEVAIEEGATVVRIGTAIFGERGSHGDHRGHGQLEG